MNQKQRTALIIALFLFGFAALNSVLIESLIDDQQKAAGFDLELSTIEAKDDAVADTTAAAALDDLDQLQQRRGLLIGLNYFFCLAGILLLAVSPFLKDRALEMGVENIWGDDEWDEDE